MCDDLKDIVVTSYWESFHENCEWDTIGCTRIDIFFPPSWVPRQLFDILLFSKMIFIMRGYILDNQYISGGKKKAVWQKLQRKKKKIEKLKTNLAHQPKSTQRLWRSISFALQYSPSILFLGGPKPRRWRMRGESLFFSPTGKNLLFFSGEKHSAGSQELGPWEIAYFHSS